MKTLKKTLCLVLAVVMVVGVLVIPANAAGGDVFPDSAEIDPAYLQAVEALEFLEVLNGKENGFDPKGTLTRAEGAMIASRIVIRPEGVLNLPRVNTVYPDVTANHWGAPAIAYATTYGMIGGMEDGKYHPNDQLTTLQFAKMLLVAMGLPGVTYTYTDDGRQVVVSDIFTGIYWATNVFVKGEEVGLFAGIENAIDNRILTREEAAQMTVNAITSEVNPMRWNPTTQRWVEDLTGALTDTCIAERVFNMVQETYETDDFGRYVDNWYYYNTRVLTYPHEPVAVLTKAATQGDVFAEVGAVGRQTVNGRVIDVDRIYEDGIIRNASTPAAPITVLKGSNAPVGVSGNGVKLEVYYNAEDRDYRIVAINEYIGHITRVNPYDERYDNVPTVEIERYSDNFVYTLVGATGFAENDVVLFTTDFISGRGERLAYDAVKAPVVNSALVNSKDGAVSFVAEGQKYEYSDNFANTASVQHGVTSEADRQPWTLGLNVSGKYNIYSDSCGYAIMIDSITNPDNENYIFILEVAADEVKDSGFANDVTTSFKYVDMDGAVHVAKVFGDKTAASTTAAPLAAMQWGWIRDDANHPGCVEFVDMPANNAIEILVPGVTSIRKDKPQFGTGANSIVTNDKTVFIIANNKVVGGQIVKIYSKYVGIANVPEYDFAGAVTVYGVRKTLANDQTFAKAVFIDTNAPLRENSTSNFIYLLSRDANVDAGYGTDGTTVIYYYDAIVDGAVSVIAIESSKHDSVMKPGNVLNPTGLYRVTYDANGYVVGMEIVNDASVAVGGTFETSCAWTSVAAGKKLKVRENTLTDEDMNFAWKLADDVVIWVIDGVGPNSAKQKTLAQIHDLFDEDGLTISGVKVSDKDSTIKALYIGKN